MNILSIMILQAPLEKFWSMHMNPCGISKVQMNSIYSFNVEYLNEIISSRKVKKNKPE